MIEDETLLAPEHSLKILWERFPTAMNSIGPPSDIVVAPLEKQWDASKNHSHPALTSA
ncbi:MAG: hypothetical protein JSW26_02870 [Desulfobacterales bacterium]|nr:MAG: hypothetical protein JSW26_02870 [Desulfobacterales bacterium]